MQVVEYTDLQIGKRYFIDSIDDDNRIRHSGVFMGYMDKVGYANKIACFENIINLPNSKSRISEIKGCGFRNNCWRFYEIKRYQIEQKREDRTLNLILRDIIGDEYFDFFV